MRNDSKKIFKISIVSIFFLFIVGFGFYRSYNLIFGVKIKNVSIVDGTKHKETVINITGDARNAKNLSINGREVSVDKVGAFDEKIALLSGYNIITIKATDGFGHIDEEYYKLIH